MAHFKKLLGLASTALVFTGLAYGQASCSSGGTSSNAVVVRGESTNDFVGDLLIKCNNTNLQSTAPALAAGTMNVTLFITSGVTFTSKILDTTDGYSEAVAWTPAAGKNTSNTPALYNAANAVLGTVSPNGTSITFVGIPTPAFTGSSDFFQVEISNIRVNASGVAVGTSAPPTISITAAVSGTPVLQQVLGGQQVGNIEYALGGASLFKNTDLQTPGFNSFVICQTPLVSAAPLTVPPPGTSVAPTPALAFDVKVSENFASAFRGITQEASPIQLPGAGVPANNVPPAQISATNAATSDTRFQIAFTNVPANVSLYTAVTPITSNAPSSAQATYTQSLTGGFNPGTSVSLTGVGGASFAGFVQIPISSGTGTAVFDITSADLAHLDSFNVPIYVQFTANTVATTSAPLTAVVSMAPTGAPTNEPNFNASAGSTVTTKASIFPACSTNLLFPFVTNQLGFDTGIAIANTGSDPFGALGAGGSQAGTCTLNFYGATAPSAAVTTANIPSGSVSAFVLSGVGAGFQGYIIAQCNFQYAHGFAFITDGVGANGGLSQGYLAGVIPDTNITGGRPANSLGVAGAGEVLGN
jgi:hypothetical protein